MVYYINPMYTRHPQTNNAQNMHSWYTGTPDQLWENPHPHSQIPWHPGHTAYSSNDYHQQAEYMHHHNMVEAAAGHHANPLMPSPTITVSGSEVSSPGLANGGNISPPNIQQITRPPPARSPYEWIKKTSYQNGTPNPGKTRTKDKYRVVYTDHQRVELEKEFYYSRYITIRRKAELANNLGLSERQVKIWFQNRRAKERKQVKKREEFKADNMSTIGHMSQSQIIHNGQTSQVGPGGMMNAQIM